MARKITFEGPEGVWEVVDIYDDGTMSDSGGDEVDFGMLATMAEEFANGEYEDGKVL